MKTKKNIIEIFYNAKNGNKHDQFLLVNELRDNSSVVSYTFTQQAKKYGIDKSELDEIFLNSIGIVLKKFDENLGNIFKFFNSVYANEIRSEIRKRKSPTGLMNLNSINAECDWFEPSSENTILCDTNKHEKYKGDELLNYIIKSCKDLSEEDKIIIKYYANNYSLKEIAIILKMNYSTLNSKFRNIKSKIKRFLKKNITRNIDELY